MLKQRIITAVVLLAVLCCVLLVLPPLAFPLFLLLVTAAGGWEWALLAGFSQSRERITFALLLAACVAVLLFIPGQFPLAVIAALAALVFWVAAFYRLSVQPVLVTPIAKHNVRGLVLGAFVLATTAVSLLALRFHVPGHSLTLLLYVFALVWAMDIGAYFAGKRFGRNKLAPSISPGKTREGVFGGLLAAGLLMLLTLVFFERVREDLLLFLLASVMAALASVLGDLYESRLKRAAGIKDSSQLLPGHGGVLDRIDGVVAAVPVFVAIWIWA